MRILLAMSILSSVFLVGQEVPLRSPNQDPNTQASTPKTYQGCVIRSNGRVMLTDASNTDYKLVRTAESLDVYVGQEVRITATIINPNDPSSDERSAATDEPQKPRTLDVEDIAKVADHCSSPK
jgi:hypothetical protein